MSKPTEPPKRVIAENENPRRRDDPPLLKHAAYPAPALEEIDADSVSARKWKIKYPLGAMITPEQAEMIKSMGEIKQFIQEQQAYIATLKRLIKLYVLGYIIIIVWSYWP